MKINVNFILTHKWS